MLLPGSLPLWTTLLALLLLGDRISWGRALGLALILGGDVLVGEDGSLLKVLAAPQPVLRITHCPDHGGLFD